MRQRWHRGRALGHSVLPPEGEKEASRELWAPARELGFSAASMAEAFAAGGKAPQGVDGQVGNAVTAARPGETAASQHLGSAGSRTFLLSRAAVVFRQKRLVFGHKRLTWFSA